MNHNQRKAMFAKQKLAGKWFRGDVYLGRDFSADQLRNAVEKYGKNVKKPTALRTKKVNGKTYSQVYYRPLEYGELD